MVLYGSYLFGERLSTKEVREALIGPVRADGRLGSGTLADIFHPTGDVEVRWHFNALHRDGAEPEMAAPLLELTYALDARPFVDRVRVSVLVLHRKGGRAGRAPAAPATAALLARETRPAPLERRLGRCRRSIWSGKRDSNPRPSAWEPSSPSVPRMPVLRKPS